MKLASAYYNQSKALSCQSILSFIPRVPGLGTGMILDKLPRVTLVDFVADILFYFPPFFPLAT